MWDVLLWDVFCGICLWDDFRVMFSVGCFFVGCLSRAYVLNIPSPPLLTGVKTRLLEILVFFVIKLAIILSKFLKSDLRVGKIVQK